jgi:tetratricopeptide (TPR) repeat protein
MKVPTLPKTFTLWAAGLCLLLAGCSAEARKSAYLERGAAFLANGDYERAEIEYRNALQLDRLNPEAIARLGIIYFDQGRSGPAFLFLRKARELQPQNVEVRLRLAMALLGVREFEEGRVLALSLLDHTSPHEEAPRLLAEAAATPKDVVEARARLLQLPRQTAGVLTGLAILHLRERQDQPAEALLRRALALDSQCAAAHAVFGLLQQARRDFPRAEEAFRAAAANAPIRSPRRILLAQFFLQTGQLATGRQVLEETLQAAPDLIPARLLLADLAAREKRWDDSLALLERVFSLDGTHPEALLLSGQVLLARGETDRAIATLEKAAKTYPRSPLVHHQLALAYLAKPDTSRATASLNEAVSLAPDFPQAILALAELNLRQRNFTATIASLKQLLQKSDLAEARLLLGNAYRLQGETESAVATYRGLVTSWPNHPPLRLNLGLALVQLGRPAEARVELTKAAELAPDDLTPLGALVALELREHRPDAARSLLETRLASQPNQAGLHLLLAKVSATGGDSAGAEASLRRALDADPNHLEAYLELAQLYVGRNESAKAMADLRTARTRNPKDARPAMLLAILHEQNAEFSEARDNYEAVLALEPRNGIALNNLACLYADRLGQLDRALQLAERARDSNVHQGETADTLGWILLRKRAFSRAISLLEDAATRLPENREVRAHLGLAYYAVGDEARALRLLTSVVPEGGQPENTREARRALAILHLDHSHGESTPPPLLSQAITERPEDPVALRVMGAWHERAGRLDQALGSYEAALRAAPGSIPAGLGAIRIARARKDINQALQRALALRKLAPNDGNVAHVLGHLTFESGDFSRAYGLLQEAARRLPDDPGVLFDYGLAAYAIGRVGDAEGLLRDALQMSPSFARATEARLILELQAIVSQPATAPADTPQLIATAAAQEGSTVPALMASATLAERRGDTEAARHDYEKVLTRFPDFSPAKRQLALLHAAHPRDDRQALELATKAREAYPGDAELARALGVLYLRTGNYARAASLLQESARGRGTDAELFYLLGQALRQLRDPAGSASALRRALDLGLREELAKEARGLLTPPAN